MSKYSPVSQYWPLDNQVVVRVQYQDAFRLMDNHSMTCLMYRPLDNQEVVRAKYRRSHPLLILYLTIFRIKAISETVTITLLHDLLFVHFVMK